MVNTRSYPLRHVRVDYSASERTCELVSLVHPEPRVSIRAGLRLLPRVTKLWFLEKHIWRKPQEAVGKQEVNICEWMDLLPSGNPCEQEWIYVFSYFCTWQFSHSVYLKTNSDYIPGHFYITNQNTRNVFVLRKNPAFKVASWNNVLFLF